jgi:hypothetical protein
MEIVVATLEIKTYQLEDFINIMLTSDYIVEIRNKDERKVLVLVKEQIKESEEK